MSTRKQVAQAVAERLWATETAIDNALAEAAALAGFMPLARMDAKLAAEVGHQAIAFVAGAVNMLIEARARVIDAHSELADTQKKLGIQHVVATGDWGEKAGDKQGLVLASVGGEWSKKAEDKSDLALESVNDAA